VTLLAVNK
jgi:hypothetical protein